LRRFFQFLLAGKPALLAKLAIEVVVMFKLAHSEASFTLRTMFQLVYHP
jgi:hypothetical protein